MSRKPRTHSCFACPKQISLRHLACNVHWFALPTWLRDELMNALKYGLQQRCHPTDQFLETRRKASQFLRDKAAAETPTTKGSDYARIK